MVTIQSPHAPYSRRNHSISLIMESTSNRPYNAENNRSWASSITASRVPSNTSEQTLNSQNGDLFTPSMDNNHFPGGSVYGGGAEKYSDNIMNRKADMNSSLYQICLDLKKRLIQVPHFEPYILDMEQEEQLGSDKTDPVTLMWNMLRQGVPLLTILNAQRTVPLSVDSSTAPDKIGKKATFKFLEACLHELKFPSSECFIITDLYGSDTTGFVKVTKVVNRVLDVLSDKRILRQTGPRFVSTPSLSTIKKSHRQNVIDELVTSERDYVQHLETLQLFKNQVEQSGTIPGDAAHSIFLNLNALLDFQRRFLIRVEQQNELVEASQDWGKLFVQYQEQFKVYEPFIANQDRCINTVGAMWEKLSTANLSPQVQGMVQTQSVLLGFLMKPFQRLTKYPLLLSELRKKGGLDIEKQKALVEGEAAASSVLIRANDIVDTSKRREAVMELEANVEDWKGHNILHFGDLVLYGPHTVLKGEGVKEVEREYKVYLFARILLCCKEMNMNKPKNRTTFNRTPVARNGKAKLQLKGRIFMQNVTDVISYAKQGSYYIQIFWKGDPGVENFVLRFKSQEEMEKWRVKVEQQRGSLTKPKESGTSETEFVYLRNQTSQPNPYAEEYEGEDDDEQTLINERVRSDFSRSTSVSNASLRSKSSANGQIGRVPPPRFPIPDHVHGPNGPPLTVSTSFPSPSPLPDDLANSHFSPAIESPQSSRSFSQANNIYSFSRQIPSKNGVTDNETKHATAPPMSRAPSRDGPGVPNPFLMNNKSSQRPSLPAMTGSQTPYQVNLAQSRLRSASTPDIHNPTNPGLKRHVTSMVTPEVEDIPIPPIPPHMASMKAPVNRSPNDSPISGQYPYRTNTQSPKQMRDRAAHQSTGQYSQYSHDSKSTYASSVASPDSMSIAESTHSSMSTLSQPSQMKMIVKFEPQSFVTIVVPTVIKHRSLIDRIDSKMDRITQASIAKGTARLKYYDLDGDFVTLGCDEDVEIAISEWLGENEDALQRGTMPSEFKLFWSQVGS